MSENSEHSPDDNEAETKTIEDLPNDSSKSEMKLMNRTDTAMLEDEEMPTYISVSSTSRRDDSDVVNAKQQENMSQEVEEDHSPSPYPSDDQAASSVYVLSSEEDIEQPYNNEDDEDEYGESDDMENLELDNEFDSENPNNMKHLMDEEDDDEDDEDEEDEEDEEDNFRQMHNDDDDDDDILDDNIDLHYDGRSDDFLLNRRIKNYDKGKSLSLQDLSVYKNNSGYYKKRHSHGLRPNYINIPQHPIMFSMSSRKQPMLGNYHHVGSKVKLYIKDIKEQNRRSMEKNMKQNQEDAIHNSSNTNHKSSDIKKTKPTIANKTIKDYAQRTIKELEIAEACEEDKVTYSVSPILLNGQDNKNSLDPIHEQSTQNEIQINISESPQNEKSPVNITDKMQKQNGTVEVKQLKFNFDEETAHYGNAMQQSLIPNGHQEIPTILYDLRTLSYEEYMHGVSNSEKIDLSKNAHIEQKDIEPETYNNAELMDVSIDNDDTACPLKIENIKSIKTNEVKNNKEQVNSSKDKVNEELSKTALNNSEIIALKNQLDQKDEKYAKLFNRFRVQTMENVKLKQKIDELTESLIKYEKKNKPLEQKVASIQTDIIIDTATEKHQDQAKSTHVKQPNNKVLGNSVASTLSSIDQWSDSTCNLSISMKPPEVAKTLHSDDSIMLTNGTPAKTTRSLSRTFITSSRILQTLSNITQGKTKFESPLVQNSKRRLSENTAMESQNDDGSCQTVNSSCRPSSSKKRKIADTLPTPNFLPYKSSQSATELHLKLNETLNDSQLKHSCDSINEKMKSQENSSNINKSQLGGTSTAENITETADDQEDNVKCFVYHENENSKDHSFLIIAKEPGKDKAVNNERRREGGPYIVGNIEVRMSEINGTINIWGKEISQESTAETENEIETSTKGKDDKKYHYLQKTPHTRFNGSNLVCSTSKKCKTPPTFDFSSAASNFSCAHSPSFNVAKASCSTDKTHADTLLSPNACISSCEDCELSKDRKEWLRYKRRGQEKLHSCCIHNADMLEQNCSLHKEKQKFEDNFNRSKEKLNIKECRRSFSRNLEPNKHKNIVNPAAEEPTCKCHTVCQDILHDPGETCQENHKCYNMSKGTCTCEPVSMNTDREYNESCNHLSPSSHEEEPLIGLKQCSETPETRRRRLTGKRVRGILMDLLRGCGDCYNSNSSNNNKTCVHKKETYLTNCPPQIKITPCTSPEPSCSNPGQPVGRCCHAYAQRIESQLEEFRVEMEKVRSRSDAILNMLNMLHSDTN